MNHYGKLAMKHWMRYAPDAVDCLIDPMEFFEDLGSQVEGMIVELAQEFEGMAEPGDPFLERLGMTGMARHLAEQEVLYNLVFIGGNDSLMDEIREDWEQNRTPDEWLVEWAYRVQDSPYPIMDTAEIERLAEDWAIPTTLLDDLVAAENPYEVLKANHEILSKAADIRFRRDHP